MSRRGLWFCLIFLSFAGSCSQKIEKGIPAAPMVLPRDLAAHDWAKTEWWYYTGHLQAPDGRRFGFEITFFTYRLGADDGFPLENQWLDGIPVKAIMSHFAVVDETTGRYRSRLLMGPEVGTAYISREKYDLRFLSGGAQGDEKDHRVVAKSANLKLDLELNSLKPAVMHGGQGIVIKDQDLGNYYLSITRLSAQGTLRLAGEEIPVEGIAWFDREFGYMGDVSVKGWDWFSIQLDDSTEIMMYAIKDEAGQVQAESQACRIDAQGMEQCLPFSEVKLEVLGRWRSPRTGADYPSGWRLQIPPWDMDVIITPTAVAQEFSKGPLPYWEGSCQVTGSHQGRAFIELVGYAHGWGQKWLSLVKRVKNYYGL